MSLHRRNKSLYQIYLYNTFCNKYRCLWLIEMLIYAGITVDYARKMKMKNIFLQVKHCKDLCPSDVRYMCTCHMSNIFELVNIDSDCLVFYSVAQGFCKRKSTRRLAHYESR